MAQFDEDLLDEMSTNFAAALFGCRPEWRAFAKMGQAEGEPESWLELHVPSPAGETLIVTTDDGEVTVAFGGYHEHFTWPALQDETHGDPIDFIDAIVTEQIYVASARDSSRTHGAWLMRPGESLPRGDYTLGGATDISARSWLGAYDLDEKLD